jgi:hypothetical protein
MNYRFGIDIIKKIQKARVPSTFHKESGFYQNFATFEKLFSFLALHPEGPREVLKEIEIRFGVPIVPLDKKAFKVMRKRKSAGKYKSMSLLSDNQGGFVLPIKKIDIDEELLSWLEDTRKRHLAVTKAREEAKDAIQELESAQGETGESGDSIQRSTDVSDSLQGNRSSQ